MEEKLTVEQFNQWIEELRSGKYEQTWGVQHVRDTNRYCAIGVLGVMFFRDSEVRGMRNVAWPAVERALRGMKAPERSSFYEGQTLYSAVVNFNDTRLKNFDQIADWLEEHRAEIFEF